MRRGGHSIFASVELAARIEHAEAEFIALAARSASALAGHETAAVPIAGGVATYAGPDSPFNKVAGLGVDGRPGRYAARRDRGDVRGLRSPRPGRALHPRRRSDVLAVVTTQPGSPSHANAQNAGFDLLCSRAVLTK